MQTELTAKAVSVTCRQKVTEGAEPQGTAGLSRETDAGGVMAGRLENSGSPKARKDQRCKRCGRIGLPAGTVSKAWVWLSERAGARLAAFCPEKRLLGWSSNFGVKAPCRLIG